MLRLDRLCINILIFGLILFIPSIYYITFIDELCSAAFLGIAVSDSLINHNENRYRLLWIIMAILLCYAIYSIAFLKNNTPDIILIDWIIELKPFVPFAVLLGIRPRLTDKDKYLIKRICLINCIIISLTLFGGRELVKLVIFHPTYCGLVMFVSCLFYLYCDMDKQGRPSQRTIILVLIFLTIGLLCGKSKYYGSYILTVFFLCLYKPGLTRHLTLKHIAVVAVACISVIAISWSKINYYFISGGGDTFDPKVIESFARPVLYVTGWEILSDYFPFGTGLASFASAASIMNYSNVYYEYGINTVFGLSPKDPSFACDAFYPSLAQFGVIGIVLFIWFWCHAYGYVRIFIRKDANRYKYPFIIGSLIICCILIESTTATTFTHNPGLLLMCLLGILAAEGADLKTPEKPRQKTPKTLKI